MTKHQFRRFPTSPTLWLWNCLKSPGCPTQMAWSFPRSWRPQMDQQKRIQHHQYCKGHYIILHTYIYIYIYIYMWQGPFGIMRPCDGYSTFFWNVEYATYILSSLSVVRDERIVFPEATLYLLAFWIKLLGGGWTRFSYDGITCQVFSILVFFKCKLNCFSVGRIALGPMPIGNGIISSKTLV